MEIEDAERTPVDVWRRAVNIGCAGSNAGKLDAKAIDIDNRDFTGYSFIRITSGRYHNDYQAE